MVYQPESDEEARFLADYDPSQFPAVGLTVDMVVLTIRNGNLSALLVQRGGFPYRDRWALPGGFANPDETLDEAAARELMEETGVEVLPTGTHLEQLKTYANPGRDPRLRIASVAYLAFLPNLPNPTAGDDAQAARFWNVDDILGGDAGELAFDHLQILTDGVERARAKLEYTTLAASFCDEPFTLGDLNRVYAAVWGTAPNLGNFRRKVLGSEGFVVPLGETTPTQRRPAQLYRRGEALMIYPPMLRAQPDDEDSNDD